MVGLLRQNHLKSSLGQVQSRLDAASSGAQYKYFTCLLFHNASFAHLFCLKLGKRRGIITAGDIIKDCLGGSGHGAEQGGHGNIRWTSLAALATAHTGMAHMGQPGKVVKQGVRRQAYLPPFISPLMILNRLVGKDIGIEDAFPAITDRTDIPAVVTVNACPRKRFPACPADWSSGIPLLPFPRRHPLLSGSGL